MGDPDAIAFIEKARHDLAEARLLVKQEALTDVVCFHAQSRDPISRGKMKSVMTREELLERITVDPRICFGKPCIRGHRIWVSLILDFLASGSTIEELLDEYPGLTNDDIRACIAWGAELARERFIEIPFPKAS